MAGHAPVAIAARTVHLASTHRARTPLPEGLFSLAVLWDESMPAAAGQ